MHSRALAVAQHLLDRLMNVYGEPDVGDVNAFVREYTHQLMQYDAEVLSEGCQIVLATHKYRRWPTPAECRDACDKARDRIHRRMAAAKQQHVETSKRVMCFLRKDVDRIQWAAWMERLSREGEEELRTRCGDVGEIATHSNFPKEYDGLQGFVSVGPFVFDKKKDAHVTGWVTVHDADGRQIR